MPFQPVREDETAGHLARQLLLERLPVDVPRCGGNPKLLADGQGSLAMIPLYTIPLTRLRQGRMGRGVPIGWRYFWTHPDLEVGATIDLHHLRGEDPAVGRYSWGRAAFRLAEALGALEVRYVREPARLQPRLLRLAAPAMEAVWVIPTRAAARATVHGLQPGLDDEAFLNEARGRLELLVRGRSRQVPRT